MIKVSEGTKSTSYPCLMRNEDKIVLFYSWGFGTVIHSNNILEIGVYESDWDMSQFSLYSGTITLENQ